MMLFESPSEVGIVLWGCAHDQCRSPSLSGGCMPKALTFEFLLQNINTGRLSNKCHGPLWLDLEATVECVSRASQ